MTDFKTNILGRIFKESSLMNLLLMAALIILGTLVYQGGGVMYTDLRDENKELKLNKEELVKEVSKCTVEIEYLKKQYDDCTRNKEMLR